MVNAVGVYQRGSKAKDEEIRLLKEELAVRGLARVLCACTLAKVLCACTLAKVLCACTLAKVVFACARELVRRLKARDKRDVFRHGPDPLLPPSLIQPVSAVFRRNLCFACTFGACFLSDTFCEETPDWADR